MQRVLNGKMVAIITAHVKTVKQVTIDVLIGKRKTFVPNVLTFSCTYYSDILGFLRVI